MNAPQAPSSFAIRADDLQGPEIRALLAHHLANMTAITPAGSMHALGVDALRQPDVRFWSAWEGDVLLGCGALKTLDASHGEVKSMRTADAQRGRGVAAAVLLHVIAEAKRLGLSRLSLETGRGPDFEPAHRLYARHGFELTGPFGSYTDDPNSVFMTRSLAR